MPNIFTNFYYCFFTVLTIAALASPIQAQDLHFSQSDLHALPQNPALSGIYASDWKAAVQYRSQWETVPVQYRTAIGSFDTKIRRNGNNMLAGGILVAQDQAGDAQLSWTQIGLRLSAAHAISPFQVLSVGFGLDMVQRKSDLTNLKFKNQWDGDAYNPGLPSKEDDIRTSGLKPSVTAGINWHLQKGNLNRTTADAGIGVAHINRPSVQFYDDNPVNLPIRLNLYGFSCIQNTEKMDYIVFAQIQKMSTAAEALVGGGARYWLSDQTAVRGTIATRIGDALIPAIQIQQNQWTFGVSYDINYSPFKVATSRRGGFEIVVVYTPTSVKPVKELKVCPIF
jgi:type IX secretion system PorP/SprF family membrane protein